MFKKKTVRVVFQQHGQEMPCYIKARTYGGLLKELGVSHKTHQIIREKMINLEKVPPLHSFIKDEDYNNLICIKKGKR